MKIFGIANWPNVSKKIVEGSDPELVKVSKVYFLVYWCYSRLCGSYSLFLSSLATDSQNLATHSVLKLCYETIPHGIKDNQNCINKT